MYLQFRNVIHNFLNFWQSSLLCHNIGLCRTIKTIVYSNPIQKTANLHNAQGLDAFFSDIVYIYVILHRHQLELNAINLIQTYPGSPNTELYKHS